MSYSPTIICLGAYQVLSLGAFTFGQSYLERRAPPSLNYDKINKRNAENAVLFQKSVPKDVFLRWERAMSAHANMNEHLGFVVGAVVVSCISGLEAEVLNKTMIAYLATRIGYLWVYITYSSTPMGYLRPVFWWSGVLTLFSLYWKSAMR